jgi:hypothetical protein
MAVRKFTVDEYHRLIEVGVLKSGDPFELLDGWIVRKMTKHPPHVLALQKLGRQLEKYLPPDWHLRRQEPITTADSEPEPDAAIVRGVFEDYGARHPSPSEVALLVEVAESSLSEDRNIKAPIYARAGILIYWIVNLVDMKMEVHTDPTGPDPHPCYRQQHIYHVNDMVPLIIDGQAIAQLAVRDILP